MLATAVYTETMRFFTATSATNSHNCVETLISLHNYAFVPFCISSVCVVEFVEVLSILFLQQSFSHYAAPTCLQLASAHNNVE